MKVVEVTDKLSVTKKNKILKLGVREVEQQADGSYIAFVDDATESFDVSLLLDKDHLTMHRCDCISAESFCTHKTALLLNITSTAVDKVAITRTHTKKAAKLSPAQQMLQNLTHTQLTSWLHGYFGKNKEAEMLFLMEFSPKTVTYQEDEIDSIIQNAFTSVMAKRKKIELNELKKIILYLQQSLEPVFQYVQSVISNKKGYLLLEEVTESLNQKHFKYRIPGTRLQKFVITLVEKYALMLNNLQDLVLWQKQADFLLDVFCHFEFEERLIVSVVAAVFKNGNTEHKAYLSAQITRYLNTFIDEDYKLPLEAETLLLEIVTETGEFKNCYMYFSIYPYENSFNIMLLQALKEIDAQLTMQYCYQAITQNTKVEFNIPYLEILEHIMEVHNMPKEHLAKVKHDLFYTRPTFEKYKFIQQHLSDQVYLKQFRNNALSRLRYMFDKSDEHKKTYLQILETENNNA